MREAILSVLCLDVLHRKKAGNCIQWNISTSFGIVSKEHRIKWIGKDVDGNLQDKRTSLPCSVFDCLISPS